MNQLIPLLVGVFALGIGSILGYYARQSIAKKQAGTLEEKIQKKVSQVRKETELLLAGAKQKASQILESAKKEENQRHQELLQTERLLLKRENVLDEKISDFEKNEKEFRQKVERVRIIKEELDSLRQKATQDMERISKLTRQEAKKELLDSTEKECQKEILERIKKLESEGRQKFEKKAKEILALAIQKTAVSQSQELTTTTVALPTEEIKGKIIEIGRAHV